MNSFLVGCLLAASLGCTQGAGVSVIPAVNDVGEVSAREEIRHDFTIHNSSTSPISIIAVTPSCSCISLTTLSGDPDAPLPPSQAIVIRATTTASGFSEIIQGIIKVRYNQVGTSVVQEMTTSFQARLRADYEIDTTDIDFGDLDISHADSPARAIKLSSKAQSPGGAVVIRDAKATHPAIVLTQTAPTTIACSILGDASMVAKQYRETIHLRTSSPFRPIVAINVRWRVRKPVEVSPIALTFASGESVTKTLTIETSKPSKLVDVRIPAGCKLHGPLDGSATLQRTHAVRLTLHGVVVAPDTNREGNRDCASEVNLTLEDEEGETLSVDVPVYFFE